MLYEKVINYNYNLFPNFLNIDSDIWTFNKYKTNQSKTF